MTAKRESRRASVRRTDAEKRALLRLEILDSKPDLTLEALRKMRAHRFEPDEDQAR